jgi:tetratricopeptide (TPR) repeat protein
MMSSQNSNAERVGQAWNHHREGRNDASIAEFEAILKQNPGDIDATYGLGLAQRAAGRKQAAVESFQRALQLVNQAKEAYQSARNHSQTESNVKTPEDDRFQMLSRMVQQRLSELEALQ